MTETTPVERVAALLKNAGFRRIPIPLSIGGLQIDAAAAFVGVSPRPDLIVVGDTLDQTPARLQQTVEGVGRALDMMGSRRPLTLVVVGPRPESSTLTRLSRHARVLPVGDASDRSNLENWLAVLLPLKLPELQESRADDAFDKLIQGSRDPLERELIELAHAGATAVSSRLAVRVDEPFVEANDTGARQ
ncbi:hypothetical protein [Rhizobium leguminosarum]|uniref:hypothetical protein n=1 Tax=Rhizobium leguminosarum TaxID=384 RepID=UPI001C943A40|nr:hypothetical protein [Rhizobium leguminosarum]MBY5561078.1 hypothetical protein [Rhizobium leguminosarum]